MRRYIIRLLISPTCSFPKRCMVIPRMYLMSLSSNLKSSLWWPQQPFMHVSPVMMTSSNGNISALLDIWAPRSPVTGEFFTQGPVTRSCDVFVDLPSRSLWRQCNGYSLTSHRATTKIHFFVEISWCIGTMNDIIDVMCNIFTPKAHHKENILNLLQCCRKNCIVCKIQTIENTRDAGDLSRNRAHYDITAMTLVDVGRPLLSRLECVSGLISTRPNYFKTKSKLSSWTPFCRPAWKRNYSTRHFWTLGDRRLLRTSALRKGMTMSYWYTRISHCKASLLNFESFH